MESMSYRGNIKHQQADYHVLGGLCQAIFQDINTHAKSERSFLVWRELGIGVCEESAMTRGAKGKSFLYLETWSELSSEASSRPTSREIKLADERDVNSAKFTAKKRTMVPTMHLGGHCSLYLDCNDI